MQAKIASLEVDGAPLDIAVASSDLAAGDVALSIPERLCVTLDRVFEDETVGTPPAQSSPQTGQLCLLRMDNLAGL
jgi:hypothetical protein